MWRWWRWLYDDAGNITRLCTDRVVLLFDALADSSTSFKFLATRSSCSTQSTTTPPALQQVCKDAAAAVPLVGLTARTSEVLRRRQGACVVRHRQEHHFQARAPVCPRVISAPMLHYGFPLYRTHIFPRAHSRNQLSCMQPATSHSAHTVFRL